MNKDHLETMEKTETNDKQINFFENKKTKEKLFFSLPIAIKINYVGIKISQKKNLKKCVQMNTFYQNPGVCWLSNLIKLLFINK